MNLKIVSHNTEASYNSFKLLHMLIALMSFKFWIKVMTKLTEWKSSFAVASKKHT